MKYYTPLINKALTIAYNAHHGQTDKSGTPYIYHPAFLAAQMDTEDEIVTALLHDVVEDTPVTFEDLEREGFHQSVLDALRLLTHTDGGDYMSYIDLIGTNPLAAKVKLTDLRHNSDPTRNANLTPKDAAWYRQKYSEATRRLEERVTERAELLRKAEGGDTIAMFRLGAEHYWGRIAPLDKRKAFDWLSHAMEKGLPKDIPGSYNDEYGECKAALYLADMLLKDNGGMLSTRTEPFWFEKPPETASEIDKIFMYLTGRGGLERDLIKAASIAHNIGYQFRHYHYGDLHPAVELRDLIGSTADAEYLQNVKDDPKETFWLGVVYYRGTPDHNSLPGSWNRLRAFEWFLRAMEKGLPKDREYCSDDHSELNATRFLATMLLRDEGGVLSTRTEPFWFEKTPEPDENRISMYIRDILRHITGKGGVERDLKRAEEIAHSIVMELSFGDRNHDPAITLRSILQQAIKEEHSGGAVELLNW